MKINRKIEKDNSLSYFTRRYKKNFHLLIVGVLLIPAGWIFESLVHTYIFYENTFWDNLTRPDSHELWMRVIILLIVSALLFYVNGLLIRLGKKEKELRESEVKLNVILESTLDGILAIDAGGNVIKSNSRFIELWKIPQSVLDSGRDDALLNYAFEQLSDPDEFAAKVESLYNSTEKRIDDIQFKDGRIFERFTAPMMMNDSKLGRVWSFRDITERRRAEKELNKLNEELRLSKKAAEESLFQKNILVEELTAIKEKLEKTNSEKDKFFSIIAHDLKSPFQVFINLTEFMANDREKFTGDEVTSYSKVIHDRAKKLYKLLRNLLEWSQMQRGQVSMNPEVIDLREIIEENIDLIKKQGEMKGISLKKVLPTDCKVIADETMLSSILRNLLSNAVKFTESGGIITVKVGMTENNMAEITIEDNGVGMPPDLAQKLFRIEEKVGRRGTAGEESTGLGLILCKEFVEKHGGTIKAVSEEGKGSAFSFTLTKAKLP